jgi:hypothetical protein
MARPYTLADWQDATETANRYRKLAAEAEKLSMEYEVERLYQEAAEFDREAEHIFGDLVARGIEP